MKGSKGTHKSRHSLTWVASSHRWRGRLFHNGFQGLMFFPKIFLRVCVVPVFLRLLVKQTLTNHHLNISEANLEEEVPLPTCLFSVLRCQVKGWSVNSFNYHLPQNRMRAAWLRRVAFLACCVWKRDIRVCQKHYWCLIYVNIPIQWTWYIPMFDDEHLHTTKFLMLNIPIYIYMIYPWCCSWLSWST